MVSSRHIRLLEQGLVGLQVLLAAGLGWAAYRLGSAPEATELPAVSVAPPAVSVAQREAEKTLEWYSPIWQRNWRQPPLELPRVLPTETKAPVSPKPIGVKLIATILEPGREYGVFTDGKKRVHVLQEEETVDEYIITQIDRDRAELTARDRSVWIEIPRNPPAPGKK